MAIVKGKNARKPYTVRYRDSFGRQREASFTTRREAETFQTDQNRAKRYGSDVNLAATKTAFNDAVDTWMQAQPWKREGTRSNYAYTISKWVKPAYEGKSVRDAANSPDIARLLVNETMLHRNRPLRNRVLTVIIGTLDMLVASGQLETHRLNGIKLAERAVTEDESNPQAGAHFLTDDETRKLAAYVGICVWLQRTMGLRISEALGVEKRDFVNGGKTLRVRWQATKDGKTRVPLKKRSEGQFRDIPVPAFIWNMIKDLPDGPLMPGRSTKYMPYATIQGRFTKATKGLNITGFTTHDLRHQFASECLDSGMNIADLAEVLGHSDPSVTLRTYVHAMPNAQDRTRDMMNARWSKPRLKAA